MTVTQTVNAAGSTGVAAPADAPPASQQLSSPEQGGAAPQPSAQASEGQSQAADGQSSIGQEQTGEYADEDDDDEDLVR